MSAIPTAMADPAPAGYPAAGDTIRIEGEADLAAAAVQYGWNGTGASASPYVLDGTLGDRQIDMAGAAVGLYIANITALYFEVKNWTINNTANDGIGIQIQNVRTAFKIHDVVINNTKVGISLNITRFADIHDCEIFDSETAMYVRASTSPVVKDNNIYYTALTLATTIGIDCSFCLDMVINGNHITDVKRPIELEYSMRVNVGFNTIVNGTLGLFSTLGTRYAFIHNNTFESMGAIGVHLHFDSENCTIVDNVFRNSSTGVHLTDNNDALVKDNSFDNCTTGISGNGGSRRMTIYHNTFVNCGTGINLNETMYGNISFNAFLDCLGYGVALQYNTSVMVVHHNVFKGCNAGSVQAFDFVDGQNQWNDTGFGNYWSDHAAPSVHDTGISDIPYTLDGGGQVDNFPLTYTIGTVNHLEAIAGAGPQVLVSWAASNFSAGARLSSPESQYVLFRTGGGVGDQRWAVSIGVDSYTDSTVLPGNTYTYSVIGNNTYGSSGNRSVSVSTPSGNVPVVNITSPAGATIFATSTITVNWEGWGNGSAVLWYEIRLDADSWINKSLSVSHTFLSVPEGNHLITVKVVNAALNTGFDAVNVVVDTKAPVLTIKTPYEGYKNSTGSILVSWSAADASSGIKNYSLRVDAGAWKNLALALSDVVTGLQNGTHSIEVRAFDNAGNSVISKVNVSVDRAAPVVTFIAPTNGLFTKSVNFSASWSIADVSGVNSSWARLINTTGAPLAWVNVTGKSSLWITQLNSDKALLIDGAWQMVIAANDTLGNNGTTVSHFTVDTVSPTIDIIYPTSGSLNNTGNVTVRWAASDLNLGQIEYRLDAGSWVNVNLNSSQQLTLADGAYVIHVRATDMAGNNATASVPFMVDTAPPSITNVVPADGSYLNTELPTFTWDATDSGSGLNVTMVTLDGVDAYIGLNKTYTAPVALSEGWHTFKITVWDNATNKQNVSIAFYVDLVSPEVVILNPADDGYYNVTDINAAWLGMDPSSGIAYYESKLDSEAWQYMGATTVRPLVLTEGAHTFSVRAFDNASNSYTTSVSFVVDLTAPLLAIDSPSEGSMFAWADVAVAWTGYDDLSGIQNYSVRIDGQNWTQVTDANTSFVFTGLSEGLHTASVKAIDNAGNYVIMNVSFTVDVTSPYVVITSPTEGNITGNDYAMVEWNVEDNVTGLSHWWAWVEDNAPVNVTGEYFHTFSPLSEGWHVIHVQAWDLVGNSQEKMVNMLVDLSAPSMVITSPANLAHLASRTVTVNFDITDTLSGVKEIWIKLGSSADWTSIGTDSSYTFTTATDTSGTPYTFLVKAQDNVGNEASVEVQFFVDTVAPSMSSHVPATGANGVLRNAQITVDFSEEMLPGSVSVALNPSISGTYLWNSAHTQVIFTPSANMAFGTVYTATVAGTDLAGNALSGTNSWSFTSIGHVTGVVKDKNGNPISGANVSFGGDLWTLSDENGNVAIDVPLGTYNVTISAPGQKDLVRNDVVVGSGTTELGDLGMTPVDDWTWLIIVIVVAVIAIIAIYFFYMKKKPQEPKGDDEAKGKK
ncbi:MAG: right-handed parallel beta-helix repeat-containing protein [Methanomassiliicoccales archaeon]|nr:right-handed parallel beta-helix repeat-containing protein [Methanomassiliicoccales archaeon]